MAFIELEGLELYAENISANLASNRQRSVRKIRRLLSGKLAAVKSITEKISGYRPASGRIPKEYEWLCDNRYIAEREGRGALLMLKRAGKLPGPGTGYPKIYGLAMALVQSGNGKITSDRIEAFITGAQKAGAFSEKELWLFIVMLKTSLVFELHDLIEHFIPMMSEYLNPRNGIYSAEAEAERIRAEGGIPSDELEKRAESARQKHNAYATLCGNLFTSLRLLSNSDFRDLLHSLSSVEKVLCLDPSGVYRQMDEESRSQYRRIVSRLAKRMKSTESDIAQQAIALCDKASHPRHRHVGYYLMTKPLGKPNSKTPQVLYFTSLFTVTALLTAIVLPIAGLVATLLMLLPLSEVAKNLCDTLALKFRHPSRLPRLELREGIPSEAKTLCIISVLLTDKNAGARYATLLERYMLANRDSGGNLLFGLLADLKDAKFIDTKQDDEVLAATKTELTRLNKKYGGGFYFFTRNRIFHKSDNRYMSWERKRGALIELTRLLSGKKSALRTDTGDPSKLQGVKYVITLDADTRLTIGSAAELVGTMMHPLNLPVTDPVRKVVLEGHGLLQPRISVELEAASRSFFSRAFAGLGGTDPYGSTISDLYQDFFDAGSFTGKGIFDVSVFSVCLDNRLPENLILSHDLIEGCYLRSGLVSDVELTDGFPHKVSSYFTRLHRWTRGDWQILSWLFGSVPSHGGRKEKNPLSGISRWKIADNLRRSLVSVLTFCAILYGMLFGGVWTAAGVAVALTLSGLTLCAAAAIFRGGYELGNRFHSSILFGVRGSSAQTFLQLIMLPYHAMVCLSAIITALYRMFITKKNLLQWITADQAERSAASGVTGMYRMMIVSVLWGAVGLLASPFILSKVLGCLWILAPFVCSIISRPTPKAKPLSDGNRAFLRRQSALMWQYFESFLDQSNHFLPPDNWQEQPSVGVARRTSPTNIGLALLCCLAAGDLALTGWTHVLDQIEHILGTLEKLRKWNGHPLNWYDTATLKPLYPLSVSSVDSGNLAACLVALSEGLHQLGIPKAEKLAVRARNLFEQMDFLPLYDRSRKLFYISRDAESDQPSEGWYDLMASEARQTSYVCIARGIIEKKHWRRLSRALVRKNGYSGMASWTGTMFEYLMPNLLLPTYPNSLLYESLRFCVYCHKLRGNAFKIPWGISESAYFAFDRALN